MNNNNSYHFSSLNDLLTSYGSTYLLDSLNLYLLTSVSIVGLVVSILSYRIFRLDQFKIALYSYLQVYSVNSAVICFLSFFQFTYGTYRIFNWSNSYYTHALNSYLLAPALTTCYFYSSILDIIVQLESISIYYKKLKIRLAPRRVCLIAFIACVFINSPFYFTNKPLARTYQLPDKTNYTIWFPGLTSFAKTTVGVISTSFLYLVRDLFVLFIQLIMNIVSIYKLKKFLANKVKLNKDEEKSKQVTKRASQMVIMVCMLSSLEHLLFLGCIIYPYFRFDTRVYYCYFSINVFLPLKRALDFLIYILFNNNFRNAIANRFV